MSDEKAVSRRAIGLIDLTELGDKATAADVTDLCGRAVGTYGTVAAVCVWPRHVALAAASLKATGVRIATVVNFPSGDDTIEDVVALAQQSLTDGADEIDLVLPYRALLAGDDGRASAMVAAVRRAVPSGDGKRMKVILETGELKRPATIRVAAELAIRNGADFIKTSTGKTKVSATLAATEVMLNSIRDIDPAVGLKPSGGIRTLEHAREYLQQADRIMGSGWVSPATFRFGASGLLSALEAALSPTTTQRTAGKTPKAERAGY